ncbi:MAG TPA: hypothetical protein VGC02_01705, partial [Methanobacterium sp.]
IRFHESTDLGIKGITAAYQYHPQKLIIILNPEYPRAKEDVERSIAHEATHGYILYKMGFCRSKYSEGVPSDYKRDVQIIFTIVEDLVVNKIIADNGFPPFGHEYIPTLREEIRVAREGERAGEAFYHQFTDNPHREALLMISRYIIAWGFLRYYTLKVEEKKLINEFTRVFEKFYPDYYQYAARVVEILEEKDIFKSDEECQAIHEILKLLKMDEDVELVKD